MTRHPDIFDDAQAVAYLGLDTCADSPEAALRLLYRLANERGIARIVWAKKHLWSKPALDRFIASELALSAGAAGGSGVSDAKTEGN